jgi:hypothetical protein
MGELLNKARKKRRRKRELANNNRKLKIRK